MKKLIIIKKCLFGLAGIALSQSSFAQSTPGGDVYINNIIYGGNGCPQGSVSEFVSPDAKSFTLLMDEYIAEIGPYVERRENRKSCQITLDLVVPPGWSYAIATFDYRGYANLDHGVMGTQKSTYYFQGQGQTGAFTSNIRGSFNDNYHFRDTLGLQSYVWSPCGARRALNIKSEVRLTGRGRDAQGIMTIDSVDGQIAHEFGLVWRRCAPH